MEPNDTQLTSQPASQPPEASPEPPPRRIDPRLWALLPVVALLILSAYFLGKYLNRPEPVPLATPVAQPAPPAPPRGKMLVTEVPHSLTVTPITPAPPAQTAGPPPSMRPPSAPFKQEEPAVVLPQEPDNAAQPDTGADATTPEGGQPPSDADNGAAPAVSQPDRDPVKMNDPAQEYPSSAYEEGVEGSVRVSFTITAAGGVEDAQIADTSGDSRLDQAALDYVRRLKFRPAIRGGQPAAVRADRTVRFSLR